MTAQSGNIPAPGGGMVRPLDELTTLVEHVASTFGEAVIVGCRGHNGTWFANAGGCEWDAEGPVEAVQAVALNLLRLAEDNNRKAVERVATTARQIESMREADVIGRQDPS